MIRDNRIGRVRADRGGDGPLWQRRSAFSGGAGSLRRQLSCAARRSPRSDLNASFRRPIDSPATAAPTSENRDLCGIPGFQGAIVSSNIVDGASTGVSVTNFDQGGDRSVTGNVLRNLVNRFRQGGELLASAPCGSRHGRGRQRRRQRQFRRTETRLRRGTARRGFAADNVLSDCGFGIVVSVAPGAGRRDDPRQSHRPARVAATSWEWLGTPSLRRTSSRRRRNIRISRSRGNEVR